VERGAGPVAEGGGVGAMVWFSCTTVENRIRGATAHNTGKKKNNDAWNYTAGRTKCWAFQVSKGRGGLKFCPNA
jgi:hypothetical protein